MARARASSSNQERLLRMFAENQRRLEALERRNDARSRIEVVTTWAGMPSTAETRYVGREVILEWRPAPNDQPNVYVRVWLRWDGEYWQVLSTPLWQGDFGFYGSSTLGTTEQTISGSDFNIPTNGVYLLNARMWGTARTSANTDYLYVEVAMRVNGATETSSEDWWNEQDWVYGKTHLQMTEKTITDSTNPHVRTHTSGGSSVGVDGPYECRIEGYPVRLDP